MSPWAATLPRSARPPRRTGEGPVADLQMVPPRCSPGSEEPSMVHTSPTPPSVANFTFEQF
jgi:hypothetical protein